MVEILPVLTTTKSRPLEQYMVLLNNDRQNDIEVLGAKCMEVIKEDIAGDKKRRCISRNESQTQHLI